jgi:hypothetical protein
MSTLQHQPDQRVLLRPPQFGLRTLLLLVTACGVLFALAQWLHPAAVGLLAFLIVSIFCHVAGNAIGTRLRAIGDKPQDAGEQPRTIERPHDRDFAPPTMLSRRQRLGWLVLVATSIGITAGAIGGGLWTFVASAGPPAIGNIAAGIVAFAVLGGMAAFLTMGFAQVLLTAMWQALSAPGVEAHVESADAQR